MRLHSALSGTSTDVEMRSRIVMRASISLRMDSIEPCWRENGWPVLCPRASSRAADAPSRCTGCHTGWLRTSQKYDASRFLCITFEHVSSLLPWGPAREAAASRVRRTPCSNARTDHTRGERQVVRRNQRRQPVRAVQPFQQLEHGPSILLVQISGRFICQQHPRPGDERPGNSDALLFPSGEFPCAVISPVFQAHLRQPLPRHPSAVVKSSPRTNSGMATFSAAVNPAATGGVATKSNGTIPKFRQRRVINRFNGFRCEVTVPLVVCLARQAGAAKYFCRPPTVRRIATISPRRKLRFASRAR